MFQSRITTPILVCQLFNDRKTVSTGSLSVTRSLLSCLSAATAGRFAMVALSFPLRVFSIREGVFELCRCLDSHPATCRTPVAASIETRHRGVIARLAAAGVDFMEVRQPGTPIDPDGLLQRVLSGDPALRIDRVLAGLCPFLDYTVIADDCEMVTCRAYRNRMVLGGRRLHEVCENAIHRHCEGYLPGAAI